MTISGELAWVPDPLRFPFLVFFACGRRNRGVRGCEARTGDEKFPAIQSHWLRIGPRNSPPSIIDFADLSAVLVGLPGSGLHLDTYFPGVVGGDLERLRFFQIRLEDHWIAPIEAPAVLNGEQPIFSRNNSTELE